MKLRLRFVIGVALLAMTGCDFGATGAVAGYTESAEETPEGAYVVRGGLASQGPGSQAGALEVGGGGGSSLDPVTGAMTFTPSHLWLRVQEVAFSKDAVGCTDPVIVGSPADPQWVDLSTSPELLSVEPPPDGEYPCVIIRISAAVRWSADGVYECAGQSTVELQSFFSEPVDYEDETVSFYLSTAGAETGEPGHGGSPPGLLLAAPHTAGPDVIASTFYADLTGRGSYTLAGGCAMEIPAFGFTTTYGPAAD